MFAFAANLWHDLSKNLAEGKCGEHFPSKPRKQPIIQLSILPGAGSLLPNDPLP